MSVPISDPLERVNLLQAMSRNVVSQVEYQGTSRKDISLEFLETRQCCMIVD